MCWAVCRPGDDETGNSPEAAKAQQKQKHLSSLAVAGMTLGAVIGCFAGQYSILPCKHLDAQPIISYSSQQEVFLCCNILQLSKHELWVPFHNQAPMKSMQLDSVFFESIHT